MDLRHTGDDKSVFTLEEKRVVFLVIAIQFINILEFMMVMPLGPDFSKDLGIDSSQLGIISGSYTLASALTGLLSASFLENFDRKSAITFTMLGLVVSTILAGLSQNMSTLLAARVIAGIFGGPSTSLALAMISDVVPPSRRGKALGAVMSSFAMASVIGVPLGLEIARIGSWRMPFFFISALGFGVMIGVFAYLPSFRAHIHLTPMKPSTLKSMVLRPSVIYSLLTSALLMASGFLIIPNLAPYIQQNLNYPREDMGILYFIGGIASFTSMVFFGQLTDKLGALPVGLMGCGAFFLSIFFGFIHPLTDVPIAGFFSLFMIASALRGISFNTLSSQVPGPHERARFMSVQSSVQHFASALGAALSSFILSYKSREVYADSLTLPKADQLYGAETLGWIAIFLNIMMIFGLYLMQKAISKAPAS